MGWGFEPKESRSLSLLSPWLLCYVTNNLGLTMPGTHTPRASTNQLMGLKNRVQKFADGTCWDVGDRSWEESQHPKKHEK